MQGFTDARMIALLVAALEEAPGPAAQAPSAPQTMPAEDGALRPDGEKRRLIAAHLARGGLVEPVLQQDWNPAERNSDDLSR